MPNLCNQDKLLAAFLEFYKTVAQLRSEEGGCSWDLAQTHQSLRKYMIEEAYEAAIAMSEKNDSQAICEELGDVLLQVVLNAQIAFDDGDFSLIDVIHGINQKMIRGHPHVFATQNQNTDKLGHEELKKQWHDIKTNEKKTLTKTNQGYFYDQGCQKEQPSTRQAESIGKASKKIGFDWSHPNEVMIHVTQEVNELANALSNANGVATQDVLLEIGDVYFCLAQLCRHLNIDAEVAALDGNLKFLRRFSRLESIAQSRGIDVTQCGTKILEGLWIEAKKSE